MSRFQYPATLTPEKAGGFMVRFIEGITRRQALMMTPVRDDRLCDDAIG